MMKVSTTIHEAYLQALRDVWYEHEHKSAPRGLPCREIIDYSFRVTSPTNEAIVTRDMERNNVIADYTAKEVELYDSCTNLAEDFGKASKFWLKLANPDGTVNSAYGHLIWAKKSNGNPVFEGEKYSLEEVQNDLTILDDVYRTPWEWARMSLENDKDTRQAILRFSLPEHQWQGNKDQTCTMHGNFLIRDDKLHLSIVMRSNDLMKGLVYDLPWFVSLMDKMVDDLKPTYPNLTKGNYTHTVHSMHIYEKDGNAILKMMGE
jgi:thymidylate synthase